MTVFGGAVMLGNASPQPNWLLATVTAFTAGTTCTVTLDGASTAVNATLAWNDTFTAGDRVWVAKIGTQLMIVGRLNFLGQLAVSVPTGVFLPWSAGAIPSGFLLCDGTTGLLRATYSALSTLWAADSYPYGAGNGTTTFDLPDGRGKTLAAMLTGSTHFGTVGASSGAETHPLTAAENGSHTHTGTSGTESVAHSHTATSGNQSVLHTHSGTTGGVSAWHIHNINGTNSNWAFRYSASTEHSASSGPSGITFGGMANPSSDHSHGITTGTESAWHQHGVTTGTESANHAHSIPSDGSGTAHENVQPTLTIKGWIVKT